MEKRETGVDGWMRKVKRAGKETSHHWTVEGGHRHLWPRTDSVFPHNHDGVWECVSLVYSNLTSSMVSLRNHLKIAIALLFGGLLFFTAATHSHLQHEVQASLDGAFANQFDGLQRLILSLLRSVPHIQTLRVDSVALEDLSYALTAPSAGFPSNDMQQRVYGLSQEVDAVATLMQGLYVEVDALVHL